MIGVVVNETDDGSGPLIRQSETKEGDRLHETESILIIQSLYKDDGR